MNNSELLKEAKELIEKANQLITNAEELIKESEKEDDIYIELGNIVKAATDLMCVRFSGEYSGKAFYLTNKFNWELKRDSEGTLCLIPTKKK